MPNADLRLEHARGNALPRIDADRNVAGSTRLLIADASADWRSRVARVAAAAGFHVVGQVTEAAQCLDQIGPARPDLLLVDADLPGGGLMTIARVGARHPRVQSVLSATALPEDQLFAALRAGADGIVLKSQPLERLPAVLHAVMAGQLALPRDLIRPVVDEFVRRGRRRGSIGLPGAQKLSAREQQAVQLVIEGRTTAQIAEEMFVAPGSVRAYVSRALSKLRVKDRAALLALASGRVHSPGTKAPQGPVLQ